jgi:hypothetical protein
MKPGLSHALRGLGLWPVLVVLLVAAVMLADHLAGAAVIAWILG